MLKVYEESFDKGGYVFKWERGQSGLISGVWLYKIGDKPNSLTPEKLHSEGGIGSALESRVDIYIPNYNEYTTTTPRVKTVGGGSLMRTDEILALGEMSKPDYTGSRSLDELPSRKLSFQRTINLQMIEMTPTHGETK